MKWPSITIMISLLILVHACKQPLNTSRVNEEFDSFYDRFHSEEQFQKARVRFPLEGKYIDPEGEKEWSKDQWEMHKQKVTDITEPNYDTEIIRKEELVIDKVVLRESGFSIERRFKRIDGRWYLVYYETVNL